MNRWELRAYLRLSSYSIRLQRLYARRPHRAGVVDSDYRGELGVVLFNFGEEDFVVNMGDKIAQLIFEKIKTPEIKETNSLERPDGETKDMAVKESAMISQQVRDTTNQ